MSAMAIELVAPRPCRMVQTTGEVFSLDALARADEPGSREHPPTAAVVTVGPQTSPVWEVASRRSPFDVLDEMAYWFDIVQCAGWDQVAPNDSATAEAFRRPGGTHPISAKVLKANPHVLVVHSEDAGLPAGAGQKLTKGRVYARLYHQGDESSAARSLAQGEARGLSAALSARIAAEFRKHNAAITDLGPAPDELTDFWSSRVVLAHIQAFAYSRMVAPWALLGVLMLRALAVTPPWVVLPALIGGRGSLNLFVAPVGPSGAGKGAASTAAVDAVDFVEPIYTAMVGSGEGLVHQYAHRQKGEIVYDRESVLFFVPEVDTLAALKGRDGSTLLPQLRSAFSGEQLGFSYVAPEKRIPLLAHGYRLGMSVGVQPERAQTLMSDADGGTPQRFVWLPVTDPAVSAEPPPEPPPMLVPMKVWRRGPGGFHTLHVPEIAVRTVRQAHARRMRGEGDALDGHALFVRLKVAQALALLDARQDMNDEDWRLAGVVMQVSDATRSGVQATLSQQLRATDRARGVSDAVRAVTSAEHVAEHDVMRVAKGIVARLKRGRGELAWSALRRAAPHRDRQHFEDAVERLVAADQVEVLTSAGAQRVRLVAQ